MRFYLKLELMKLIILCLLQLNQNTPYLDASVVYGSTEETAESLREFFGGRMRVSVIDGSVMLPIDETRQDCVTFEPMKGCFVGGDQRVNQYTSLTVLHTLFVRVHNRYAAHLSTINPHWDDERLYQETKRIVGALMQHITYNEYLPSVLGIIIFFNGVNFKSTTIVLIVRTIHNERIRFASIDCWLFLHLRP